VCLDVRDGPSGDVPPEALEGWFTRPGAVVLPRATAGQLGIEPGDAFGLEVGGRIHDAVLLALADRQGGYDELILTDIAQAQEWLGLIGRLSRIDVRVPPGAAGEAALAWLRERLPAGVQLQEAQLRARQSLDMTSAFTTNLQAMSLLALLVGAFLIYSTISFAVVQRRRTIAVLRALGELPTPTYMQAAAEVTALTTWMSRLADALYQQSDHE